MPLMQFMYYYFAYRVKCGGSIDESGNKADIRGQN